MGSLFLIPLDTMRSRGLADGSRSRLQEREPAHVVAQVHSPPYPSDVASPNALHPRPLHLVDHAAEHVFDAYIDPGSAGDYFISDTPSEGSCDSSCDGCGYDGRASLALPPEPASDMRGRPIPNHCSGSVAAPYHRT